jgi:hypothetical protein
MQSTDHLCPRRAENPMADRMFPGPDKWDMRDGVRCCSYCGSMHPEDVFLAIAEKVEFGPTDKSYKVYVDLPNPNAGKRVVVGSESGPAFNVVTGKPNRTDLSIWEMITNRYSRKIWGTASAKLHAKFYFQHFDRDQQARFINLLNVKAVNIGYPGHFYRLPFFCVVDKSTRAE